MRPDPALRPEHVEEFGSAELHQRAVQALTRCVGDTERVRGSIELAWRIVADLERRSRSLA